MPAADRPPQFDLLTIPRAPACTTRLGQSGTAGTMILVLIALPIISGTIAAAITAVTG